MEEDEGEGKLTEGTLANEGRVEDTPSDRVSPVNVIDVENIYVVETQADKLEDPTPL